MPQGPYKDQLQWHVLIDLEDEKTGYVNIKCSVLNNFHVFKICSLFIKQCKIYQNSFILDF